MQQYSGMALDQAPTAVDVFAALSSGGDGCFDALTYSVVAGLANGTLSISNNGDPSLRTRRRQGQRLDAITYAQAKQIGTDIDGEAAGDYSGYSVALSSTLAVGGVRFKAVDGSAWSQPSSGHLGGALQHDTCGSTAGNPRWR